MVHDNENYPAVASFDKIINDVRFVPTNFNQNTQMHEITIDVLDIDERFLFDTENDRLMNLLVPQQFKVRLDRSYYVPESVEYQPVGHLSLRVLSPVADIHSVTVHVNMRYFENGRIDWDVPENIKEAFSYDSYNDDVVV
ncbi:se35 [Alphabaculovirus alterspexiguae]|uniref:Se35 n=1 Tax=Spodoptera exigua multiple nucleopolyhedrovirus TaxID=10454 RepID=A0A3G2JTY0_9ABAC|nr:se35 [Spodoptera exigua multiple nucleopolyhedrovirus]AYN44995.1 se35 [Spodoptera exigua multiple nucleopolyhedrovirus]